MHIPVKILETNLHIAGYCSIDHIYTVVNGLIDCFVAVNDYDLALQFSGIVIADKTFQFVDQFPRFCGRDELGRLDKVYKQLYFCQFKFTGKKFVSTLGTIKSNDVKAVIVERLYIIVNTFSLGTDTIGFQISDNLWCRDYVRFVCLTAQIIKNIKKFLLLFR